MSRDGGREEWDTPKMSTCQFITPSKPNYILCGSGRQNTTSQLKMGPQNRDTSHIHAILATANRELCKWAHDCGSHPLEELAWHWPQGVEMRGWLKFPTPIKGEKTWKDKTEDRQHLCRTNSTFVYLGDQNWEFFTLPLVEYKTIRPC